MNGIGIPMITTPTTEENCSRLLEAIKLSDPIIVQGDVGSGKSFLIRELAKLHRKFDSLVELSLDSQTDSKTLLGTYICSDVPGEFIWQAGVVTQAALNGDWLVIEDVDRAPLEVIAALSPLLERRRIQAPEHSIGSEVEVHPEFRIFGTRTHAVNPSGPTSLEVTNLKHFSSFWHFVSISLPSKEEIVHILSKKFPMLLPVVVQKLLLCFHSFLDNSKEFENFENKESTYCENQFEIQHIGRVQGGSTYRKFTLRDLMKVAGRVHTNLAPAFNQTSKKLTEAQNLAVFKEVVDTFAAAIRQHDDYCSVLRQLGRCFGVSDSDLSNAILEGSPEVSSTVGGYITVGRVRLTRFEGQLHARLDDGPAKGVSSRSRQQFAVTKYSARLLERVAACVASDEPVLLVGETGSGKTTTVQELADLCNQKLLVQNLSLSTDTSDLLGGYRPVTIRQLLLPIYQRFVALFEDTFPASQNQKFLQVVAQFFKKEQWKKLVDAFCKAQTDALKKLELAKSREQSERTLSMTDDLENRWKLFSSDTERLRFNLPKIEFGFAFAFIDGLLVDAMRQGHWLLLDEINLASAETLQALAGILDGQAKLCLTDRKDMKHVERHPEFRIFAAMNPPTDVGKRELPLSLRCRFTEIYTEELTDHQDLCSVVSRCLHGVRDAPISDIVSVYLGCRSVSELVDSVSLVDGAGQRPRFSLRSLTRSLRSAMAFLELGLRPITRALFEGFLLNFYTMLGDKSRLYMWTYLKESFQIDAGKQLQQPPPRPGGKKSEADEWVLVKPFWLRAGQYPPVDWANPESNGLTRFVMTPTIEAHIRDLSAAIAADVAPILLQGPTSAGKTTMIEYLAARTGHKCVRINNHEHTDVQEYIGGYVTNDKGHLEFRDGLLVTALRCGFWIILDELNLAPSDVLEALNRLLDDNKELLIAETGEIVKPAKNFALFATQNPPGVYGGRKVLSRAFRNRFIELAIDDLPLNEVEIIITNSCGIAPKFSSMLVKTMKELQLRRQESNLFLGKYGSITTRDLIKWGRRQPQSAMEVACEGYMLVAEKLRSEDQKEAILTILNEACSISLDVTSIYEFPDKLSHGANVRREAPSGVSSVCGGDLLELSSIQAALRQGQLTVEGVQGIAITDTMKRLWKLVGRCIHHDEPALLIGETGTGKTTVCQLYAAFRGQKIKILNCHQTTETADIIGGLRPVRGRENLLKEINEAIMLSTSKLLEECGTNEEISRIAKEIQQKQHASTQWTESTASECLNLLKSAATFVNLEDESTRCKRTKVDVGDNANTISNGPCNSVTMTIDATVAMWIRFKSLFEWQDGPLVTAMKNGEIFLLDEINLADDAVIERINSVLEPGRSITLAEKSGLQSERIVAHPNFKFLATMNPGGDFGKRELSPALRSRFTEIFVPGAVKDEEIVAVVVELLDMDDDTSEPSSSNGNTLAFQLAQAMVHFVKWIEVTSKEITASSIHLSIREILAWAKFIRLWIKSASAQGNLLEFSAYSAFLHGAFMMVLDGFGTGLAVTRESVHKLQSESLAALLRLCPISLRDQLQIEASSPKRYSVDPHANLFSVGRFSITCGSNEGHMCSDTYSVHARSTLLNFWRVLRAMQISRPILLEGPPGSGKSSLVTNLAKLSGHKLVRINLSEHSEISDLLGTDLPVTSDTVSDDSNQDSAARAGKFVWCDGVFLQAMKNGDWVLLDELNLAPQSVLEGLNACLDHRGEVFLPEIGKYVHCSINFRVFCAQNPMVEGGGRKGLPQSFLSRFSRVFVESMTEEDMLEIAINTVKKEPAEIEIVEILEEYLPKMVRFVRLLQLKIVEENQFGRDGSPWEFNLRDVLRWCEYSRWLLDKFDRLCLKRGTDAMLVAEVESDTIVEADSVDAVVYRCFGEGAYLLFVARLRQEVDRRAACQLYAEVFGHALTAIPNPPISFPSSSVIHVGLCSLPVIPLTSSKNNKNSLSVPLFGNLAKSAEMIASCLALSWPILLVGLSGSGKRRIVRHLVQLTGNRLIEFSATSSTDSTELLGSFEQRNPHRQLNKGLDELSWVLQHICDEAGKNLQRRYAQLMETSRAVTSTNSLHLDAGSKFLTNVQRFLHDLWNVVVEICVEPARERARASLLRAKFSLDSCCHSITRPSGFEWVDGLIVDALESGHWLLIDNVNLCSASVLDRLNSILEPNGSMLLTESGEGRTVRRHPDFRIIFCMDPSHGEISRAMRNRCAEFSLLPQVDTDALVMDCLGRENVSSRRLNLFTSIFEEVTKRASAKRLPRLRLFRRFAKLVEFSNLSSISRFDAIFRGVFGWSASNHSKSLLDSADSNRVDLLKNKDFRNAHVASSFLLLAAISLSSSNKELVWEPWLMSFISSVREQTLQSTGFIWPNVFETVFGARQLSETLILQELLPALAIDLLFEDSEEEWQSCCENLHILNPEFEMKLKMLWPICFGTSALVDVKQKLGWFGGILSTIRDGIVSLKRYHFSFRRVAISNLLGLVETSLFYVTNCSLWWKLAEAVFFDRLAHILDEERLVRKISDIVILSSLEQMDCLFELAIALDLKRIGCSSKELRILAIVILLLKEIDNFTNQIIEGTTNQLASGVSVGVKGISSLIEMLRCRDLISSVLRRNLGLVEPMIIPWDELSVLMKWLQRAISAYPQELAICSLRSRLHSYHSAVSSYFGVKSLGNVPEKLWKCGGHPAVPARRECWSLINSLIGAADECEEQLPSFVEAEISLQSVHQYGRETLVPLLKEWVSLLSTVLWSSTNESQNLELSALTLREAGSMTNQLVARLKDVLNDLRSCFAPLESVRSEAVHEIEQSSAFTFDEHFCARISSEISHIGDSSIQIIYEPMLIVSFLKISDEIASFALLGTVSPENCRSLVSSLKTTQAVCLRYSNFHPMMLRELQSLQWLLDAYLAHSVDQVSILFMARSIKSSLDAHIYQLFSRNAMNFMTVPFTFDFASVNEIVEPANKLLSTRFSDFFSCTTFSARLAQPVLFELLFKHVDPRIFNLRLNEDSVAIARVLNGSDAFLSIRNFSISKQQFYRMLRNSVIASNSLSLVAKSQLTRLNSLALHVIDILQACTKEFCADFHNASEILRNLTTDEISLRFQAVSSLLSDGLHHLKNENLKHLMERCLPEVVDLLSLNNHHSAAWCDDHKVEISRAWCLVGLLRLHLVIPLEPVDPAIRPATKAYLLDEQTTRAEARLQTEVFRSALAGEGVLRESIVGRVNTIQISRRKIDSYRSRTVERPLEGSQFHQLHNELRSFVDSIADFDSVFNLIEGLSKLPSDSTTKETRSLIVQKELAWQSSVFGFVDILRKKYSSFPDVTGPVLSAIQNLSCGLRELASESITLSLTKSPKNKCGLISWWKNVMAFPQSLLIPVDNLESAEMEFIQPCLSSNLSCSIVQLRQEEEGESIHKIKATAIAAPQLLLRLALSRIEYLQICKISNEAKLRRMFYEILDEFVQVHRKAEEERKRELTEAASLYKNRVTHASYESNAAKDEEASLRIHFPDHLRGLREVLEGQVVEVSELFEGNESIDGASQMIELNEIGGLSAEYLVGHHARMVFVHWAQSTSFRGLQDSHQFFLHRLNQSAFNAAKCLERSIFRINDVNLDRNLRGGSLFSLSTILSEMNNSLDSTLDWSRIHDYSAIDRDLLLLLDPIQRQKVCVTPKRPSWNPINFHTDAIPSEVYKASEPLMALLMRTCSLLAQFPGNEILSQLCKVTAKIMEFHVNTPLGKMLISLQLLLQKVDEWELFSASHCSLQEETKPIVALIQHWRELELQSWQDLLRAKEVQLAQEAMRRWFMLAQLFKDTPGISDQSFDGADQWVRFNCDAGTSQIVEELHIDPSGVEDASKSYISSLFQIVDEFLQNSTVGEFATRLHLVRLFALQILQETNMTPIRYRVGHILYGIWRYYDQFLPVVRSFQDKLKRPLEEKLLDQVKINKWDKLNTYALIQHSERVHRQLNKLIREYQQDVLEYPVVSVFRREMLGDLISEQGDRNAASEMPTDASIFPLLPSFDEIIIKRKDASQRNDQIESSSDPIEDELSTDVLSCLQVAACKLSENSGWPDFLDRYNADISKHPKFQKINHLASRMDKYFADILILPSKSEALNDFSLIDGKIRYALYASNLSETMANSIFERIQSLRQSQATRTMKHRAMTDLIGALREEGVSNLKSSSPTEAKQMTRLLALPAPLSFKIAVNLFWNSSEPRNVVEKAEGYFFKNVAEINQLRAQVASPSSPDISSRDIHQLSSLCESLYFTNVRCRFVLTEAASLFQEFHELQTRLHRKFGNSTVLTEEDIVQQLRRESEMNLFYSFILPGCGVILDSLRQLLNLVRNVTLANQKDNLEKSPAITALTSEYCSHIKELLNLTIQKLHISPPEYSSPVGQSGCVVSSFGSYFPEVSDSGYEWKSFFEKLIVSIRSSWDSFNEVYDGLAELVSDDVCRPILAQFGSFRASLEGRLSNHCMPPSPTVEITASEAALMENLSVVVDNALIAFQKLRSTVNLQLLPSEHETHGSSRAGIESEVRGAFGEKFEIRSSQSLSLQSALSLSMTVLGGANTQLRKVLATLHQAIDLCNGTVFGAGLTTTVLPLIERVAIAYRCVLNDYVLGYKSCGKLLYVVLRVVRTLLAKGFCSDKSETGEGEGDGNGSDMKFEDDVEGTGMGEGDGKKDVSDQIQNEDQIAGLKDDPLKEKAEKPDESKQLKQEEQDKGVEMTQDFDGEYFDLADENEDENKPSDEESEGEDIDREMGDANEEDIVDEKQWDDNDDDAPQENEKFEKNSKTAGEALEDEMTTGEDQEHNESSIEADEEEEDSQKKKESKPNAEGEPEGSEQEKVNEEEEKSEKPLGVDVQENEEKPDDETADQDGEEGGEKVFDGEEAGENEAFPEDLDFNKDGADEDSHGADDPEDLEAEPMDVDQSEEEARQEDSNHDEDNKMDEDKELGGNGGSIPEAAEPDEEKQEEYKPNEPNRPKDARQNTPAFGVDLANGNDSILSAESKAEEGISDEIQENEDEKQMEGPSGGTGTATGKGETGDSTNLGMNHRELPDKRQSREPPNPYEQKGDINEQWKRYLNLVANDDESCDDEDANDAPESADKEGLYEKTKEHQSHTDQVLDTVAEENAAPLPPSEEKDDHDPAQRMMDEDQPFTSPEIKKNDKRKRRDDEREKDRKDKKSREDPSDSRSQCNPDGDDTNLADADSGDGEQSDESESQRGNDSEEDKELQQEANTVHSDVKFAFKKNSTDSGKNGRVSDDDIYDIEFENGAGSDPEAAKLDAWQSLRHSTESHAMRLCEQLRLILEPTLATRLQGDYRTGKRINMRKVIGYVASGFRKDKIWLRRTKPAKRDYQVMLMIDNSRSMSEAGHMALSALSIISTALSRLEVGELSVVSFADKVRVVHPFGQPFNDFGGAQAMASFDFSEERTMLASSLQAVAPIFAAARNTASISSSNTAILQLCFVVTDARLEWDNREKLANIVRSFSDDHVLVVLIVIDKTSNPKDSIFVLRSIEFKDGKLVTSSYLDNFPFPYYVVIKKLDGLPDVLADALKQWFEMIGSQLSGK